MKWENKGKMELYIDIFSLLDFHQKLSFLSAKVSIILCNDLRKSPYMTVLLLNTDIYTALPEIGAGVSVSSPGWRN